MDIIRRNTDYAFRLITAMIDTWATDHVVSAKALSGQAKVSYALTCKLLQRLQKEGYIQSTMGSKGGFRLARPPEQITFLEIIEAIQGPLCVNRCQLSSFSCPLKGKCPLHGKFLSLQKEMIGYLKNMNIGQLVNPDTKGTDDESHF